jgi:hypothetical protein
MGKTRRQFVKEIAGAAVAGSMVSLEARNAQPAQAPQNGEALVAPCGLYCGACPMYLDTQTKSDQKTRELMKQFSTRQPEIKREDFLCDGCLGKGQLASFCRKCAIRSCAASKPTGHCSGCSEFPCPRITNFNNDGMQHHSEVLANLRRMREKGVAEWATVENDRWQCPQCRARISWYDRACSKCGAKRSERLFPLKQA